jgi:hypothetical protein
MTTELQTRAAGAGRKRGKPRDSQLVTGDDEQRIKTLLFLPAAVNRRAKALANLMGRPLNDVVEAALLGYIAQELPRHAANPTRAA